MKLHEAIEQVKDGDILKGYGKVSEDSYGVTELHKINNTLYHKSFFKTKLDCQPYKFDQEDFKYHWKIEKRKGSSFDKWNSSVHDGVSGSRERGTRNRKAGWNAAIKAVKKHIYNKIGDSIWDTELEYLKEK